MAFEDVCITEQQRYFPRQLLRSPCDLPATGFDQVYSIRYDFFPVEQGFRSSQEVVSDLLTVIPLLD